MFPGQLLDPEGYAKAAPTRRKPQVQAWPGAGMGRGKARGVGATVRGLIRAETAKRGGILERVEKPARE